MATEIAKQRDIFASEALIIVPIVPDKEWLQKMIRESYRKI